MINYTSSDYNVLTNNGISFIKNSYILTIGSSFEDIPILIRISKLDNTIQIIIVTCPPPLSGNGLIHSKKEFIIPSNSIEEYDDLELCAIIGGFLLDKNLSYNLKFRY